MNGIAVEYRCKYCLSWLKSLDELDMHRSIHEGHIKRGTIDISLAVEVDLSNPDIAKPVDGNDIADSQIAQSETPCVQTDAQVRTGNGESDE